ncbi:putative monooxygenase [Hyaloraphidium curvatum]|nr:putative monooxygenase [Hyaloraphidium curvatum]
MASTSAPENLKALFRFDFDPAALKQRYRAERDKRLNPKGNDQYTWIQHDNEFAHLLKDPWAPEVARPAMQIDTTVLVIGGGFSGMVSAIKFHEAGMTDFKIIEKGADFGGNWYWNRYPGAACDSEGYCYVPLLEETGYMPPTKYPRAPDILEHCRNMGRKWDLYSRTLFQTECSEVRWDEPTAQWVCLTDRGDTIRARFVVAASGPLHKPKLPGVPGIPEFKGKTFHTSRWDYNYTGGDSFGNLSNLRDKRVAIIGTGATAIQCVPHLGEASAHLYVFQRTPSGVELRRNRPTDPAWWREITKTPGWQKARDLNFTAITSGAVVEDDLVMDGWTDIFRTQQAMLAAREQYGLGKEHTPEELLQLADYAKMESIRRLVDETVRDKDTAEKLKPWYNRWCKRPCFSDSYLQTFNRSNVTLVDTNGKGVDRIDAKGVVYGGKLYEVDCIIWATGFEIGTSWKSRNGFELVGRGGVTLQKKWRAGMRSLFGICTRDFPSFFMYQTAQAGASFNFPWIFYRQAEWALHAIQETMKRGADYFEVSEQAERDWQREVVEKAALRTEFLTECTPGFYSFEGQVNRLVARNSSYGEGPIKYAEVLDRWVADGGFKGLEFHKREAKL